MCKQFTYKRDRPTRDSDNSTRMADSVRLRTHIKQRFVFDIATNRYRIRKQQVQIGSHCETKLSTNIALRQYYYGIRNYQDHVSLGERGETSDEGGSGGDGGCGGSDDGVGIGGSCRQLLGQRTKTSIIARLGSRSGPYSRRTRPPAPRNPSPRAQDPRSPARTCS